MEYVIMLSWSNQEPHNIYELYRTGAYAMGHYLKKMGQ